MPTPTPKSPNSSPNQHLTPLMSQCFIQLPQLPKQHPHYSVRLPQILKQHPHCSARLPQILKHLPHYSVQLPQILKQNPRFPDQLPQIFKQYPRCFARKKATSASGRADFDQRNATFGQCCPEVENFIATSLKCYEDSGLKICSDFHIDDSFSRIKNDFDSINPKSIRTISTTLNPDRNVIQI